MVSSIENSPRISTAALPGPDAGQGSTSVPTSPPSRRNSVQQGALGDLASIRERRASVSSNVVPPGGDTTANPRTVPLPSSNSTDYEGSIGGQDSPRQSIETPPPRPNGSAAPLEGGHLGSIAPPTGAQTAQPSRLNRIGAAVSQQASLLGRATLLNLQQVRDDPVGYGLEIARNLTAQAHTLGTRPYGASHPIKGWGANIANAFTHELLATGGATALREALASATEAVAVSAELSPEVRGLLVSLLFSGAVMANGMAMVHKYHQGSATKITNAGHVAQIALLLGTAITAGATGRGQDGHGAFGLLSTLLPSAVKSYAYLSRDVVNLLYPLKGNHDDDYKRPVRAQLADSAGYFLNQEAVNVAQGAANLSGAGFVDGLRDHSLKLSQGIGELSGYTLANAGGEGLAAMGARAAAEVARHGVTLDAAKEIRDLRLTWGKMDTSVQGGWKQYVDKAAGAQTARLSLFLALYAASAVVNHFLERGDRSNGRAPSSSILSTENALGALLIIAGCLPFAMSTATRERRREGDLERGARAAIPMGNLNRVAGGSQPEIERDPERTPAASGSRS
ncbi:hypothetical protein G3N59_07470 [Paraburkholderia sp. Ac-20340]|uniref:hypothetical protein n=1 Tax=Paraburkholderia sp. Ac-20340 TaxID=2703888 RepID=UPI00197DF00F|nr:hypothetical protein [Paraburkholderia sp. Ac-20340]MBN3853210.1 hypothetical protein [Paraburkholderia sp. Ac-20340]